MNLNQDTEIINDSSDIESLEAIDDYSDISEEETGTIDVSVVKKSYKELTNLTTCQELRKHTKAIWIMKFSLDRKYLATAGEDGVINIWKVRNDSHKSWDGHVFEEEPIRSFTGHTNHVVDLAWSKNGFIISASLDCTVRLWHVNKENCICIFKHKDMVTSVDFYPEEEYYFLSGCMDRKLRLWSIHQGCVLRWVQAPSIITAVQFCPGGRLCAVGLADGQVIFYYSDGLRYFTQAECRNRYGKDKKGRKVTGISFIKSQKKQYMVVTTNDSRIRLISLDTFGLVCKIKGNQNRKMQLRATMTSDNRYLACGSDDNKIYMWKLNWESKGTEGSKEEIKRYDAYECFNCCLVSETVSSVLLVPDSIINCLRPGKLEYLKKQVEEIRASENIKEELRSGYVFVAGTTEGTIHVFSSFSIPTKVQ